MAAKKSAKANDDQATDSGAASKSDRSAKAAAWAIFDRIVEDAAPKRVHSNPWVVDGYGLLRYEPEYDTLARLLGVPLALKAGTRTGVPALALDVWLSYELRRSGFDFDQTWPRAQHPRIMPAPVANLLRELPRSISAPLLKRLEDEDSIKGVTSSSAAILGKNYLKQVDVIISDWATGPEVLISTKRMDSSYGKNAPNRIEESYGDAKNLRLRHPLAALGFVFGLRSDILQKEPLTFEWLVDLLGKLGREDDAYHATCLILMEYTDGDVIPETGEIPATMIEEPGAEAGEQLSLPGGFDADCEISKLPRVSILNKRVPEALRPGHFLAAMVSRVLETTPVTMHRQARERRASPKQA